MKISLCAFITANSPLEEQIAAVKAAGITQVEVEGCNGVAAADMTETELAACRAALDAAGLTVYALATDLGNIGVGDHNHNLNEVRLYPTMRAAQMLGTKKLRIFLHTVTEEQKQHLGIAFAIMAKTNRFNHLGDQYLMCIENGTAFFADTEERMTYSLDRLYLARSVFNPAAYLAAGKAELTAAVKTLLNRATYLRLADGKADGTLAPIGAGECDIAAILGEIYKDTVLSVSSQAEPIAQAAATVNQMLTSLGYTYADGVYEK